MGAQQAFDVVLLDFRVPDVDLQARVPLAHVQHRVDGLLLHAEQAPVLDLGVRVHSAARRRDELCDLPGDEALVRLEHRLLLLQLDLQGRRPALRRCEVRGPVVEVGAESLADLADLGLHVVGSGGLAEVHDEDALLRRLAERSVAEDRVSVAATGFPERAVKPCLILQGDDSRQRVQDPGHAAVLAHEGRLEPEVGRRVAAAPRAHQPDRLLGHLQLLLGLRVGVLQGVVPSLEAHEGVVQPLELRLDRVQSVRAAAVRGEELVDPLLGDRHRARFLDLLVQPADDALHLVDALHVLPERPAHVLHVLKLDIDLWAAQFLDVLP
mmetsp:Transcript_103059/g.280054  ORF Transcript_103059/g.280054 Transcript_103059/m.280054 type:complete len:325 (+) Transcript_103059:1663-2637(+)